MRGESRVWTVIILALMIVLVVMLGYAAFSGAGYEIIRKKQPVQDSNRHAGAFRPYFQEGGTKF